LFRRETNSNSASSVITDTLSFPMWPSTMLCLFFHAFNHVTNNNGYLTPHLRSGHLIMPNAALENWVSNNA
jgi:hypothetical protein